MATVTLDLPNQIEGAKVEVDGLGIFENGYTHELDDADVQVYIAQRANADGYAFRNGSGVTFGGVDEYMYPEEVIEQPENTARMPGEVVHLDPNSGAPVSLDNMTIKQLNKYNDELDTPYDLSGLKKFQMVQALKGEDVTEEEPSGGDS